jgi:hypothetical protein
MNEKQVAIATHRLHDFFVGRFGHVPRVGIEFSQSGRNTNRAISRYEFAIILDQIERFYTRILEEIVVR